MHRRPSLRLGDLLFDAVIEARAKANVSADGTPARATLSVTFRNTTLQAQLREPRRVGRQSKRRQLDSSDALWLMASREYGDPAPWRMIANASDLDDPLNIEPGTWLSVPPLDSTI
jgi:nucleoid-associated protein YgaU